MPPADSQAAQGGPRRLRRPPAGSSSAAGLPSGERLHAARRACEPFRPTTRAPVSAPGGRRRCATKALPSADRRWMEALRRIWRGRAPALVTRRPPATPGCGRRRRATTRSCRCSSPPSTPTTSSSARPSRSPSPATRCCSPTSAWDLQAYSGGRFVLGLGSQIKPHITKRFSMPWSHPHHGCGRWCWPSGPSGTAGSTAPSSTSEATSTPTR